MNEKRALILFGSPNKKGATNEITVWAEKRLEARGFLHELVHLYEKKINPCVACCACQRAADGFTCVQKDDVLEIAGQVMQADLLLVASPVHGNFIAAPPKCLLDRLTYILNQYIGRKPEDWNALWDSKHLALLISYGMQFKDLMEPIDLAMRMYCKHSRLFYDGYAAVRRKGFMMRQKDPDALPEERAAVEAMIDRAVDACLEGRKADWSALTGEKEVG